MEGGSITDDQLIADLIKENKNVTIKEYLELKDELEAIRKATEKLHNDRSGKAA